MMAHKRLFQVRNYLILGISLLFLNGSALAINDIVLQGQEDEERTPRYKIIPYAFYNEYTDLAVSAAFVASGYYQPQLAIVGNAFTSSNDSTNGFLLAKDLQLYDRWFLDTKLMKGDFGLIESY